jgi:hypothetical protein
MPSACHRSKDFTSGLFPREQRLRTLRGSFGHRDFFHKNSRRGVAKQSSVAWLCGNQRFADACYTLSWNRA